MEAFRAPRGLIVDLITPLSRDGDIDGDGLGRHLDRVLPHVQALFLASPYMGEGANLTSTQREELFERSLAEVQGRVPILIWISQGTEEKTSETLLLLKKKMGLHAYTGPVFWVDTPLFYHSNRGLSSHYKHLSSMVEDPFILHNDPALIGPLDGPFKRENIRTSILKELAHINNIQGLIFLGSLDRGHNYQKAVRSRMDFRIYDGDESHFLRHPSLSGVVSQGANLAPRAWQRVTASSLNLSGDQKGYPDYLQQIWELGEYLGSLRDIYHEKGVSLIKQVLSDMGIIENPTCTYRARDVGEEKESLKELMERHGDYHEESSLLTA